MDTHSKKRVLVGFSGGVDSAVAAMLLRDQGYEVAAVMMSLCPKGDDRPCGCGEKEDAAAAGRLADTIGVPLHVVDCSGPYRDMVLDYFRREYLAGRTPNPCVQCNPEVKFGAMPRLAEEHGLAFDAFATGHYAQIDRTHPDAVARLRRGADTGKDQSYFLYRLTAAQLSRTVFPLGCMTKAEVRRIAAERGLPVHDKPDSQDFHVGDYSALLGVGERPGDIVMQDGKVMGKHQGYWNFTPGQRKGLGVAYSEPLYVIRVEPETNRVVVGTRAEGEGWGCVVRDLRFNPGPPEAGAQLLGRLRSAQALRAMHVSALDRERGEMRVEFDQSVHGVAPGQSLVLYDGDFVLGGGVIESGIP